MMFEILRSALIEFGVDVKNFKVDETGKATFEIDFSEHDKKVTEEKDGEIRELKRWVEVLEEIIADSKKPDISVSENGVSVGCEYGGYHLAKERISELERDLKECKDEKNFWKHELARVNEECDVIAKDNRDLRQENRKLEERFSLLRTRCKPGIEKDFDKGLFGKLAIVGCNEEFTDIQNKRISELEDRHQSDCIEINRLNVALEVMTEKYMKLREVHGLG